MTENETRRRETIRSRAARPSDQWATGDRDVESAGREVGGRVRMHVVGRRQRLHRLPHHLRRGCEHCGERLLLQRHRHRVHRGAAVPHHTTRTRAVVFNGNNARAHEYKHILVLVLL